jgi:hypothetical protein
VSSLVLRSIETGLVGDWERVMVNVVEPDGSLIVEEAGALTKIEAAQAEDGRTRIETRAVKARTGTARERRGMGDSGSREMDGSQ